MKTHLLETKNVEILNKNEMRQTQGGDLGMVGLILAWHSEQQAKELAAACIKVVTELIEAAL